jgi:hypothetical protein
VAPAEAVAAVTLAAGKVQAATVRCILTQS